MKPAVWITGAGGFTGRHLARFLRTQEDPPTLIGLGRSPAGPGNLDFYAPADITDPAAIAGLAATHPPDTVFHLAGLIPPAPEAEMWRINVGGTHNLLQVLAASTASPIRVVLISSAAVYHPSPVNLTEMDPAGGTTPYGRSKWCMESVGLAMARTSPLKVMIARPFNLMGPGLPASLIAGSLCARFRQDETAPIHLGNLSPFRDFIDIRDAVAAYWEIGTRGRPGNIYNVCTGRATRVRTLVSKFARTAGSRREIVEAASAVRAGNPDRACGDNSRLSTLGWRPRISLQKSISDMLSERMDP